MRTRRRMLIASTSRRNVRAWSAPELAGAGHERADVLGQAAAAEAEAGVEEARGRCGRRWPIASASSVTSAPAASQSSAIALMKEILVARNELAATLTSSAVARSVTSRGCRAASDRRRRPRRARRRSRSSGHRGARRRRAGRDAGCPRRRGPRAGTRGSTPVGAGTGSGQLLGQPLGGARPARSTCPTTTSPGSMTARMPSDGGVDVGQVRGALAVALRRADADEVHRRPRGGRGVGGEHQPARLQRRGEQVDEARARGTGAVPCDRAAIWGSSTSTPTTSWPRLAMHAACTAPR